MHFNDSASAIKWNEFGEQGHEIYVQVINFPAKLFKATTRLSPENNNNELVTISKILAFISSIVLRMLENRMKMNVLMLNTRHI